MKKETAMATPAPVRYYVGDLCYVLTRDEWDTVCNTMDFNTDQNAYSEDDGYDCEGCLDPELFDWDNLGAERPYFIFNTAYGDGRYNDRDGNPYSVDSGTIGAIRVDYILDKELLERAVSNGLGHIHEFDSEFGSGSCFYENGLIGFENVEIDTAGDYDIDEEEEIGEDGEDA
jgi:hypothetical protein